MTADPQFLISLIDEAKRRGVNLWAAGNGKLSFRAAKGALTDELRSDLATHRDAIVAMISGPQFRAHGPLSPVPFLEGYATGFWQAIRSGDIGVSFTNAPQWIVQVDGPFSVDAFAESVRFVATRQTILDSMVRESGGLPAFHCERAVALQVHDLPGGTQDQNDPRLVRLLTDIAWRPFDTEAEHLFRPFVVRVSDTRHIAGFVLHHVIGDVVSVGLIRAELLHGYEALVTGKPLEAIPPEVQYSDYILAMNTWLRSPARDYRLAFWRRHLDGVAPCKLEVDRVADPDAPSPIENLDFTFRAEHADALQRVAHELSTTLYFVLLAASARALAILTNRPDAALISMYHGRDSGAIAPIVGSMQNQLLLRVPDDRRQTLLSLARECLRIQSEALEYQLPLGCINWFLPDIPTPNSFPEFNCFIADMPANRAATPEDSPIRIRPLPVPNPEANRAAPRHFPGIKLSFRASESEIAGRISYLASEYDASTIARLADAIVDCLEPAGAGAFPGSLINAVVRSDDGRHP